VVDNLSDRRVYIIGDFNDVLTDNMANNVFANFLEKPDVWRASDMSIAEGSSSGWSFPGWPSHLDHIIINQPLFEAADGPDAEVHVIPLPSYLPNGWSQYDEDISDHLPVVLKLKL
jgi:endonuclease/exonuclease/phosphatase family metal-dependent hydrolase